MRLVVQGEAGVWSAAGSPGFMRPSPCSHPPPTRPPRTVVITIRPGLEEQSWSPGSSFGYTEESATPAPSCGPTQPLSIIWADLWVLCPDWLLFGDCEIVEDTMQFWKEPAAGGSPGTLGPPKSQRILVEQFTQVDHVPGLGGRLWPALSTPKPPLCFSHHDPRHLPLGLHKHQPWAPHSTPLPAQSTFLFLLS